MLIVLGGCLMDFREQEESQERKAFRQIVREWMEYHKPQISSQPSGNGRLPADTQAEVRKFRVALGKQGWIAPTYPKEIGGGGLPPVPASIIQEEIRRLAVPFMGDNDRWIPAMMLWGTNEQRRKYLLPALRGESITWQLFSEPQSGSDLAEVRTTAVETSDGYLINGQKAYITGRFDPDQYWTLAVTSSDRPQKTNLGIFMIDASIPGVSTEPQRLLNWDHGNEQNVFLENVLVPKNSLVGGLYQGWEIAQTILEGERGGFAFRMSDDGTMESIMEFLKEERERNSAS